MSWPPRQSRAPSVRPCLSKSRPCDSLRKVKRLGGDNRFLTLTQYFFTGPGFPIPLFTDAVPADVSVVVNFLDGRNETVLSGETVTRALSGLYQICTASTYVMHPLLKNRISVHVLSQAGPGVSAVGTTNANPVIFRQSGQHVEAPVSQNIALNVFGDFPELTAIGREALQTHCDAWLRTSVARQSRIKEVTIGQQGSTLFIANVGMESPPDVQAGEILYFPLDYLLNYLIEHGAPSDAQDRLKAIVVIKRFSGGPGLSAIQSKPEKTPWRQMQESAVRSETANPVDGLIQVSRLSQI